MNTRVLRMCYRTGLSGDRTRIVEGLGQLQPVLFGFTHGTLSFRCEDLTAEGRWCWMTRFFPQHKADIKKAFAELEACAHERRPTPANTAWVRYCAEQAAAKVAAQHKPKAYVHATGQSDLLGGLL